MSYVTPDWHNGCMKGKSGVTLLISFIFQMDGFRCGFMEALMDHGGGRKNTRGCAGNQIIASALLTGASASY